MNASDNHNITELNKYLREEIPKINNNLSKIERAIYGDPVNGVQGLIDYNKQTQHEMKKMEVRFSENVKDVKERVHSIEKLKNKIAWMATGLITGASALGASIWELLSKIK